MTDQELTGRIALVTGANQGIGAAVAESLAAAGAAVVVTGLRLDVPPTAGHPTRYAEQRARTVDRVVTAIRTAGGQATGIEADLSDDQAPVRLFDRAEAEFGGVDILVNNASGWAQDTFAHPGDDAHGRPMGPVTAASFAANFLVDARAAALLIAEFASRHRERAATWGRIVGLTSGGPHGFPSEVSYGAAKAAQDNYTLAAATELSGQGITANVVYPPVTDTGWVTEQVRDFVTRSAEHTHVAEPSDVAAVVRWLCSHDARLVTGNVIRLR